MFKLGYFAVAESHFVLSVLHLLGYIWGASEMHVKRMGLDL